MASTILEDSISRYVTRRIHDHANWYQHKSLLATPFELKASDEATFYVIHEALLQLISSGHTVLKLDNQSADTLGIASLQSWQSLCLEPILLQINQYLDTPFGFDTVFDQMNVLLDDAQALPSWTIQQVNALITQLKAQPKVISDGQITQVRERFLWVLRAYYVMQKIAGGNLMTWAQRLPKAFFTPSNIDGKRYDGEHIAPIRYSMSADAVYLWTQRAYRAESQLMAHIHRLSRALVQPFGTDDIPEGLNAEQAAAVKLVATHAFGLITGGPGTGKTYTVAQIVLALMRDLQGEMPSLALAAPTGKAAQRMSESLQNSLHKSLPDKHNLSLPEPKTIHRLLGMGNRGKPRYDANNPLPYQMIIIDEASMLGTELACQLLAAIATGTRVILLGDANQLAAVDAGAVLADLCRMPSLSPYRVNLVVSQRFDDKSAVGQLAKLVQSADDDTDFAEFDALVQRFNQLHFYPLQAQQITACYDGLVADFMPYFELTKQYQYRFATMDTDAQAQAVSDIFETLNNYRILCASHMGACGDDAINTHLSKTHRKHLHTPPSNSPWYHGRVVMVTQNRYDLGLFNGDIGVCLWGADGLTVYFEGDSVRKLSAEVLDEHTITTAYAITVHKSQGSEWEKIAIVFDETNARLLSKELIYTAITRAKSQVVIYSTKPAITLAMTTPTVRQTGLAVVDFAVMG
ncbi:exodeoxyribonuclease V subunit alpha [uncultured Moraxella sp.]|uniref:exodeoxyribonuclease V subunit alpha n=1 Tax=uncultured Moraxella sp. TaxID=263769 RepID=UPI0025D155D4|nr:exodeoxyribonuclease V subunit alpha [uncultured Moraxella sp.]